MREPRPLLLSSSDAGGGAARAAYRLHEGLRALGVDSAMLVQRKRTQDPAVHGPSTSAAARAADWRARLNKLPLLARGLPLSTPFSPQWLPDRLPRAVARLDADVVHLHWVCGGFMHLETPRGFERPVVWTLHDMWAFTGGCHYSGDCRRFLADCGRCPVLGSDRDRDLSHRVWKRKAKAWAGADLSVVTPSHWLADEARASALFRDTRIDVIANGLDTTTYSPGSRDRARARFGLPQGGRAILFGALQSDRDARKGGHLLREALARGAVGTAPREETFLVVLGASGSDGFGEQVLPVHYLPPLSDDRALADAYRTADVFVAPSVQENLSNMVVEALACGTPCVAFDVGGMPDMIDHRRNGYLARPFDTADLARGICFVLEAAGRGQGLRERARERATTDFDRDRQAGRYLALYRERMAAARKTAARGAG